MAGECGGDKGEEMMERYKLKIVKSCGDQYIRCEPAPDGSWVMVKDVAALQAHVAELEAALRELIDQTHDCEKELTRKLYRIDFCGESLLLTNARAALKAKLGRWTWA